MDKLIAQNTLFNGILVFMKKHEYLNKLHPMDAFGVVSGLTNQIRVTRLEKRLDPAVGFPHKHNFYHLVLITSGSGWHEIDFQRHIVKSGALFLMAPAQVHSWSMSKDTTGIVIEFENLSMFTGDESYILNNALNAPLDYLLLSGQDKKEIEKIFLSMFKEYEEERKNFEIILKLNLATFLLLLTRVYPYPAKNVLNITKFRDDFLFLIEKNYKQNHAASFYAKKLGIETKSLTAKVNRVFGKSVRDLIQERCILESKRMLAYSDLSVSAIAMELGFDDPNYFTRFFKLKTKTNPGKFREKVKKIC